METEEMLSGDLKLNIGGEHYELNLSIPAKPVKPQRMLPVFRKLTNEIVARGVERSSSAGEPVSCTKGCAGCCRQALLVSEAEVFDLYDVVEAMPAEQRVRVKARFRAAREHFEKLGWFDRFDQVSERAKDGPNEELARDFIALLTEYISEQVACPFLEDESCSIYDSRPLTCREYLVTSPAANCRDPRPDNTRKLRISGSASKAFSELTKTVNSEKPSSLLLIRMFEFAETHTEKFDEKIGPAWADAFFRLLTNRQEPGLPQKATDAAT